MIGSLYVRQDKSIGNPGRQILADIEVVDAPPDIAFAGAGLHVPPGILAGFRMEQAQGIHKTTCQESVEKSSFLRQESLFADRFITRMQTSRQRPRLFVQNAEFNFSHCQTLVFCGIFTPNWPIFERAIDSHLLAVDLC